MHITQISRTSTLRVVSSTRGMKAVDVEHLANRKEKMSQQQAEENCQDQVHTTYFQTLDQK